MVEIARIETFVFRYPLSTEVRTSFGTMRDRPLLIVRLTDTDGATGYGEIWCNFPSIGGEYRARLIDVELAPRLTGRHFDAPGDLRRDLTAEIHLLALQTGEIGALANCIAGLDAAFHDLCARRADMPLCAFLGTPARSVPVYASGINPHGAAASATSCLDAGYVAIKFKMGFGSEIDLGNAAEVFDAAGGRAEIAVDTNQFWSVGEASEMLRALRDFRLMWLEEPIAVDRPDAEWAALAEIGPAPLAGGENMLTRETFQGAIETGHLAVIQPDVAKWGGVSGCLEVARAAMAGGRRYCPHFLGGGIGLMASAHLLAATGGDGLLEVDINPNPLRSDLLEGTMDDPASGMVLPDAPGLGITPDLSAFSRYQTHYGENRADRVIAI